MLEGVLNHVLLVKEGSETGVLLHTASTYRAAQRWVKKHGCSFDLKVKYYFKVTSAELDLPYISYDSGRELELLTMEGEEIRLFDVWLVHTENGFPSRDKVDVESLTKEAAEKHIQLGYEAEENERNSHILVNPFISLNKIDAEKLTKDEADEHIYFGHADEPSPDRSEYWNLVRVPHGFKPAKYQRK